jgi:pimeloyl-ACP methyl ester carboxylesterase
LKPRASQPWIHEVLASHAALRQFSSMSSATRPAPALRRAYLDCRFGQLHVYQAIPSGGGFDEATAVICIPGADGNAAVFAPWLPLLGVDRSIYAIDLPGCGMSDAGRGGSRQANGAAAIGDFMANMRLRRANLLVRAAAADVVRAAAGATPDSFGKLAVWDDGAALAALASQTPLPRLLLDSAEPIAEACGKLRQFLG